MSAHHTFIGDVLAGKACLNEIDHYVDQWHDAPSGHYPATVPLHVFLGMNYGEYTRWVQHGWALPAIVESYRALTPLAVQSAPVEQP